MRVATLEETLRYGTAGVRRAGRLPPILGAAGWALGNVAPKSVSTTVVGTTGVSLAFGTSPTVTAGDVIVAASLWATGSAITPTFSDTSSNVTTWNTTGNFFNNTSVGLNVAISWGTATSTGACTPKVTWNSASSAVMELFIGDFVSPGGTISQDGTLATAAQTAASGATITTPTGNGTGANDLVVGMIGCGASFSAFGSPWTAMGPSTGDDAGYVLNSAAAIAANATQNASSTYISIILALQASGAATGTPYVPYRMPLGV